MHGRSVYAMFCAIRGHLDDNVIESCNAIAVPKAPWRLGAVSEVNHNAEIRLAPAGKSFHTRMLCDRARVPAPLSKRTARLHH